MARVTGRDTRPEMAVRRAAHALGLRYRLHRPDLPGRPDLVFPRHRGVIFVHGCFWHRHPGCRRTTSPKTRREFWQAKFDANIERDRRAYATLEADGWRVVVIWECEALYPAWLGAHLLELVTGTNTS
jgi:DNA mismatch endonuclease, patch repair protein